MCIGSYADISVHAPTRGATSNSLSFSIFSVFQSTLPREERLLQQYLSHFQLLFQSTLPREERPLQHQLGLHRRIFQSTLPREERHTDMAAVVLRPYFNPRSHERSDTTCDRLARGSYDFNPRSHERSDRDSRHLSCRFQHFNPRSHERSDIAILLKPPILLFQSTLPREERPLSFPQHVLPLEFQSTLPREERLSKQKRGCD